MTSYIFPGQGSQAKGMGANLFSEFPDYVQIADQILGYSLTELCLENPNEALTQTHYTQPALYTVNALSYFKKIQESAQAPDYVAGHSLGEYNALLAAEVFDFATGLKLVQKRGELMSQASGGGMAAVLGLKNEHVQAVLEQEGLHDITIANYNSYTQLVISGPKESITNAKPLFEKAGATLFIPLKVSGAFHSPYLKEAQAQFSAFATQFQFHSPKLPVIANVNARPYEPHEILTQLTQQITHSVRWTACMEYLLEQGETDFVEVGPGTVLSGLLRRIRAGQ